MSQLDWEQFTNLPGAANTNWERLCGAVIRRGFGSLGRFRYVAQQPGVEFHLNLERSSRTLGDAGRWWGWQCRWYGLPAGQRLGATRRKHITDAIRKTQEKVPGITDWVLWTRRPLTPADQEWFDAIESTMRLHLWTEEDLDAHLVDEAGVLRSTYFGDLILTPDGVHGLREQSIAPIRERWMPEVHIPMGAEHEIRKVLGEPEHWPEVQKQIGGLSASVQELDAAATELEEGHRRAVALLADDLKDLRETFKTISNALTQRQLATAIQMAASDWTPRLTLAKGRQLAGELRRNRHHCAFVVQAGLARQIDSSKLFAQLQRYLSIRAIAVVGPANVGKTHLSAALTDAKGTAPCGLYLEAWPLSRRGTVDELLARLEGVRAQSFVQILEAMDAAGARAGVRLPVVIDGLNESEDPANWSAELARLQLVLGPLQHIVLIVTLRPPVAEMALPSGFDTLELHGFGRRLTEQAVKAYFDEFKIDSSGIRLPIGRFSDPLFLRIFCEATNPNREFRVRQEQVPTSLTSAFIAFQNVKVKRIAERRGGVRRYEPDIRRALDAIALSLWETNRRAMPFDEIRDLIGDDAEDWTQSLARAMRDEGILGAESHGGGDGRTVILFDAFAGFLIADALIRLKGRDEFAVWVAERKTAALLGADQYKTRPHASCIRAAFARLIPQALRMRLWRQQAQGAHPLAPDIRRAFVALVPRQFRLQFWKLVDGDLREEAIVDAADLEGQFLDAETIDKIAQVSLRPRTHTGPTSLPRRDLFSRFHEVRDAVGHPLNAEFVDNLLSDLSVADRDLRWTEWVRNYAEEHFWDLDRLTEDWKSRTDRTQEDRLRALWVKWLLTSTLRDLRDVSTRALYWYGRGEPGALFNLTLSSLGTNDPYIPERLLAASFGVTMAAPGERRECGRELDDFVEGLWKAFCADDAEHPTDHWLIRHYVEGIVGVARRYYPLSLGSRSHGWRFVRAGKLEPIVRDDPRNSPYDLVYGRDFANYTVGSLVPDRGNYQFDHQEYQEVCSWIRARVWDLGWRNERFGQVERRLAEESEYRHRRHGRIELYQKKYGWVGFFEAAGRLIDEDRSPLDSDETRLTDVDIDPSFPAKPPRRTSPIPGFLSAEFDDLEEWVTDGTIDVSTELLRPESLDGTDGPWVALSGFLDQEDIESRRKVFGFLHAILVERDSEQQLRDALGSKRHLGNLWLHPPEAHYVFAGEMTWSACARLGLSGDELRHLYTRAIPEDDEEGNVSIELPARCYAWESYHSVTNEAGGYPVPAIALAESYDLRVIPASLDWIDPQGNRASMTLAPPSNFKKGHLLYVREDLIRDYCAKHNYELVWIIWGERDVWFADYLSDRPDWLTRAHMDYSHVWRRIASLNEMAPA